MPTLWAVLEERTRHWTALARQALADAVWQDQVLGRFDHAADTRALPYLYPYLRHHDRQVRLRALAVAGRVFAGAGRGAIADLTWFTGNPDLFIRDRAVQVVASAMRGAPVKDLLETLTPFCLSTNRFVRHQALTGLASAAASTCSGEVVELLEHTARSLNQALPVSAVAEIHAGHPSELLWRLITSATHDQAVDSAALLVRCTGDTWFKRALAEVFVPRFSNRPLAGEQPGAVIFRQRNAVLACGRGGHGQGMRGLAPMQGIGERCAAHATLIAVHDLFEDAEEAAQRPLLEQIIGAGGPQHEERLAIIAYGRLLMTSHDEAAIALLRGRCSARNGAIRAAAVQALGCIARSSANGDLLAVARPLLDEGETVVAALRAIGLIALGTGNAAADAIIRTQLAHWSAMPRGKHHYRPLAACLWALGLTHLGTGDMSVLDALLPIFALPDVPVFHAYRSAAAKAVSLIEHGEPGLTIAVADPARSSPGRWGGGVYGSWTGLLTSLDP